MRLDIVGATFVREVENGEIVIIENNELNQLNLFQNKKQGLVSLNIFILLGQIV